MIWLYMSVRSLKDTRHNKITNLWKFSLDLLLEMRDTCNYERKKKKLVTQSCMLSDAWFQDLKFYIWGLEIKFVKNYFFLQNYVTSEGAVSHIVLHYQPLPITRYQVGFMLIIILSNYQKCPLPLKLRWSDFVICQ